MGFTWIHLNQVNVGTNVAVGCASYQRWCTLTGVSTCATVNTCTKHKKRCSKGNPTHPPPLVHRQAAIIIVVTLACSTIMPHSYSMNEFTINHSFTMLDLCCFFLPIGKLVSLLHHQIHKGIQ